MKRRRGSADPEEADLIRLAWWASFLATVALIAILGFARSAQALTLPAGDPLAAAAFLPAEEEESAEEEEEEEEEEEGDYDECEFVEEECEAEEDEEAQAPRECVLASASATVTADPGSDKVRLSIRYTAYAPGSIQFAYWLRGGRGPLSLGNDRGRLGTRGVIRDTDTLSSAQMSRALAARNFTIRLRPAHAPRSCDHLLDRHLTVRKNASGRLTWSDPGPILTAARQG